MLSKIWNRLSIVVGFFGFLWRNKLWWLIPMVLVLLIFGAILFLGHSTPLGPFIYTIF